MRAAWMLPLVVVVGFTGPANAEKWTTNSKLLADRSAVVCGSSPDFEWTMEFTENKLTGYNKLGSIFSTTAASDGTVKVDFRLAGLGVVTVYGNAKTRDLEYSNPFFNCRYKLIPSIGYAQASSPQPVAAAPAQATAPTTVPPAGASPTASPTPPPLAAEEETRRKFVTSLRPDDIRQIQTALSIQGLYTNTIDGSWGPGTDAAVRAWQVKSGIPATGVLSSAQVDTFVKSASAAPPPPRIATSPQQPPPDQLDRESGLAERERQIVSRADQVAEQRAAKEQAEREHQIAERERLLAERAQQLAEQKTAKEQADRERQIAEQKTAQQRADEEARQRATAERVEKDRQLGEREKQLAERERVLDEQERQLKSATGPASPPIQTSAAGTAQWVVANSFSGITATIANQEKASIDIACNTSRVGSSPSLFVRLSENDLGRTGRYQFIIDGQTYAFPISNGSFLPIDSNSRGQLRTLVDALIRTNTSTFSVQIDKNTYVFSTAGARTALIIQAPDNRVQSGQTLAECTDLITYPPPPPPSPNAAPTPPKAQRVEWNDLVGDWVSADIPEQCRPSDPPGFAPLVIQPRTVRLDMEVNCQVLATTRLSDTKLRISRKCAENGQAERGTSTSTVDFKDNVLVFDGSSYKRCSRRK